MSEVEETLIIVVWEETPQSEEKSDVPDHEHHRHEVHVLNEGEGKTYLIHGRDGTWGLKIQGGMGGNRIAVRGRLRWGVSGF
jgi:hypothetical protein